MKKNTYVRKLTFFCMFSFGILHTTLTTLIRTPFLHTKLLQTILNGSRGIPFTEENMAGRRGMHQFGAAIAASCGFHGGDEP